MRLVQFGAVDGVDHQPLAGGGEAHDPIARERMAALAQGVGNPLGQAADGDRLDRARLGLLAHLAGALELRKDRLQHLMAAQGAAPDIGKDIFRLGQAQLLGHFLNGLVGQLAPVIGESLFQDLASEADMLVALGVAQEAADFRPRPPRDHELLPQG